MIYLIFFSRVVTISLLRFFDLVSIILLVIYFVFFTHGYHFLSTHHHSSDPPSLLRFSLRAKNRLVSHILRTTNSSQTNMTGSIRLCNISIYSAVSRGSPNSLQTTPLRHQQQQTASITARNAGDGAKKTTYATKDLRKSKIFDATSPIFDPFPIIFRQCQLFNQQKAIAALLEEYIL